MFIYCTQAADKLLIGAAEDLQELAVLGADLPLKVGGGLDQFMLLQRRRIVVSLNVSFTVRGQARHTGPDGFALLLGADVTLDVSGSSKASRLEPRLPQSLDQFSQHGVLLKDGPRSEHLSALGTNRSPFLIPAVIYTAQAITVSTWDGHRDG